MKTKLIILLFSIAALSNISAASFSTIDNIGLSFTDPLVTQQVSTVLCTINPPTLEPTCISQFVNGKIINKIPDNNIQQISLINPDAANSIKTFNKIKDIFNRGNKVGAILGIDKYGNVTQGNLVFGYDGAYIGTLVGLSKDEESFAKNVKVEFNMDKKFNQVTFFLDNNFELYQNGQKTVFQSIRAYEKNVNSSLKLNLSGNITEANFSTIYTIGNTYIIGNDEIYVPANSRLEFKNGNVKVFISDNADLKQVPKLTNSDLFGNEIEVKGNNIKLPDGNNILDRGIITYKNGVPFVNMGDEAVINGFKIAPVDSNVELKLDSKGFFRSAGEYFGIVDKESGNYVRVADEVEINGKGFGVNFNPEEYVSGTVSESYLEPLSLSNAKSGKYFGIGDRGEDVKLIQRLVGVEEDGVFGKETERALKTWQSGNNLLADGKFGKQSLQTAVGFDKTKNIELIPNGGRIVASANDGKLNLDFNGDATFKLGSESFFTNKVMQNIYMKKLDLSESANKLSFKLGDKGENVKLIQRLVGVDQTGVFDKGTDLALKNWQKENNLLADGKFGKQSLQALLKENDEIYKKINDHLFTNSKVPIEMNLRESDGSLNKRFVLQDTPHFVDTLDADIPKKIATEDITNGILEDVPTNTPLYSGKYVYLDRAKQIGYYIEDKKVLQEFSIGVGTGNDPDFPNPLLSTPEGEFTVNSVEYNKPVGKWSKDIPFGLLEPNEGYTSGLKGKLLSVYGPGFIVLKDSKGRIVQQGIHGTSCIGSAQLLFTPSGERYVSHGCIRMFNSDWKDLITKIKPGTKVIIG
ncbi:L,D-transpeptidase family protein [Candidatus Pacearchaeota archaeon]|nr:L,D-transpeptidase family protein [Candidatus Pacearchaeota archaeon]